VPAVFTEIAFELAPVVHRYPVAVDDVSVTLPLDPILVDPLAEIVGAAGAVSMVVTLFVDWE